MDKLEKTFRFQYHTNISGKNYRTVVEMIKKVLKDNYLKIEVTEVAYDKLEKLESEITALNSRIGKLKDALKFYSDPYHYRTILETASCGCCSYEKDPCIFEDDGKRARQALAEDE